MTNKNSGYIYIIINPAVEGFVKIGKTTRTPEERVKELSSATGVPQPFILVYSAYFNDCTKAENYIHTKLREKRISSNKEFFRVSSTEAINLIVEAKKILDKDSNLNGTVKESISPEVNKATHQEECEALIENADNYLHGYGDFLRDEEKAIEIYKEAINMGCYKAYYHLGYYYYDGRYSSNNYASDLKQSIKYFKEGTKHNIFECWKELANCFTELEDYQNADKCWVKVLLDPQFSNLNSKEMVYYIWDFVRYMNNEGKKKKDLLSDKFDEILMGYLNISSSLNAEREIGEREIREREVSDIKILKFFYNELTKNHPTIENTIMNR